jgi:hypothetical protein
VAREVSVALDSKEALLARLDAALAAAVPLSPVQSEEVGDLAVEIASLWDAGRLGEAKRCFERAMKIIAQGPPSPE